MKAGTQIANVVTPGTPEAVQKAATAGHLAHGLLVRFSSGKALTFGSNR